MEAFPRTEQDSEREIARGGFLLTASDGACRHAQFPNLRSAGCGVFFGQDHTYLQPRVPTHGSGQGRGPLKSGRRCTSCTGAGGHGNPYRPASHNRRLNAD